MKPALLLAIVAAAGFAGAAGYWLVSRPTPVDPAELPTPAHLDAAQSRRLVETLPDIQLVDRDGQMRSLREDWAGRALIVNFWATWCAPCRREIPLLQRIAREQRANGFEVVGIAVDFRDAVLAYAQEMGIDYPLLIGEQDGLDAASAFGVESIGFPFTVFTDNRGRVITAHLGELHAEEAEFIVRTVADVNAGRMAPADARAKIAAARSAGAIPDVMSAE